MTTHNISRVVFDDAVSLRNNSVANDVARVVEELQQHGHFALNDQKSPQPAQYQLHLSVAGNSLTIDALENEANPPTQLNVPFLPLKRIIKDYVIVCESYHQAISHALDPSKVEAIDMGRRGLHNEGAELVTELLSPRATVDFETARRIFTLIYVLHIRG